MADTKLTALAAGLPTTDDLLYFVDTPAGTPTSKKCTIADVLALVPPGGSITIGTTPIVGGVADRILVHSAAGDVVAEVAFTGTGNVVRSASPTFTGTVTFANLILGAANNISMATRFLIASSVLSQIRLMNPGDTVGVVLDFATTAVLKVFAIGGTIPGDIQARSLLSVPNTVANLPTGIAGMRAGVTDASQTLTAGIGTVVAGGGANKVPVYFDGTNWLIG